MERGHPRKFHHQCRICSHSRQVGPRHPRCPILRCLPRITDCYEAWWVSGVRRGGRPALGFLRLRVLVAQFFVFFFFMIYSVLILFMRTFLLYNDLLTPPLPVLVSSRTTALYLLGIVLYLGGLAVGALEWRRPFAWRAGPVAASARGFLLHHGPPVIGPADFVYTLKLWQLMESADAKFEVICVSVAVLGDRGW